VTHKISDRTHRVGPSSRRRAGRPEATEVAAIGRSWPADAVAGQSLPRFARTLAAAPARRLRRRISLAAGLQDGFTLIEVLFVAVLGVVVIAAPLDFMVQSLKQQNVVSSRAVAERQGQAGLQQLVRDLREAVNQNATSTPSTVTLSSTATTHTISFSLPTASSAGSTDTTPLAASWTCTNGAGCIRQIGTNKNLEITGVQSVSFTGYDSTGAVTTSNPDAVAVTLTLNDISQLDTSGTHTVSGISNPITLQTTIDLRNFA
jgi:prepilin-type N-terminal cleavage/methylation domain-containing protein